jgi:hypothetical protein
MLIRQQMMAKCKTTNNLRTSQFATIGEIEKKQWQQNMKEKQQVKNPRVLQLQ